MKCTPIQLPDGARGFICGGPRRSAPTPSPRRHSPPIKPVPVAVRASMDAAPTSWAALLIWLDYQHPGCRIAPASQFLELYP